MNDKKFDNIVAFWKNKKWVSGSKYPYMSGSFTAPRDIKAGETIKLSVWANEKPKSDKSPQWSGKEDTYQKPADATPAAVEDAPW